MPLLGDPIPYAGRGAESVPEGGALQADLVNMARTSAAKKNLQTAFDDTEKAPNKMSHDVLATANVTDAVRAVDPNDIPAQVQALDKRASALEKEADMVQKSGTGNFKAQQTYLRAAAIVRTRARTLHARWMASLTDMQKTATQPAATSQPAAPAPMGQPAPTPQPTGGY
jgi:hypothetical protein